MEGSLGRARWQLPTMLGDGMEGTKGGGAEGQEQEIQGKRSRKLWAENSEE